MTMRSRRSWARGGDRWCPAWRLSLWAGLSSWLLGVTVERHPREWQAWLHLGPVALLLERVR